MANMYSAQFVNSGLEAATRKHVSTVAGPISVMKLYDGIGLDAVGATTELQESRLGSAFAVVLATVGGAARCRSHRLRASRSRIHQRARGGQADQAPSWNAQLQEFVTEDALASFNLDPLVTNAREVVKDAWARIPSQRPRLPANVEPNEQGFLMPVTFGDMFCFEAALLSDPEHWPKSALDRKPLKYDVICVMEAVPLFIEVMDSVDGNYFAAACKEFTKHVRAKSFISPTMKLFKRAMLSSFRALLPEEWTSEHEVAFEWLYASAFSLNVRPLAVDAKVSNEGELTSFVQTSWRKLRTKQPPCPRGQDKASQLPRTFQGMVAYKIAFFTTPQWHSGEVTIAENMNWVKELFPVMANIVGEYEGPKILDVLAPHINEVWVQERVRGLGVATFYKKEYEVWEYVGMNKFQKSCFNLGDALLQKGVKAEAVDKFEIVFMASMRALLPHDWNPKQEVAWKVFWQTTAALICSRLDTRQTAALVVVP